jgi:hypothetical protein
VADPVEDAVAADLARVARNAKYASVSTPKGTVSPRRGTEYAEDIRALRGLQEDALADLDGHFGFLAVGSEWSREP